MTLRPFHPRQIPSKEFANLFEKICGPWLAEGAPC
jgi:hypothetical protein